MPRGPAPLGFRASRRFLTSLAHPVAPELNAPALPALERVLVVDDHEDSAEGIARSLKTLGVEVRVAFDGIRALQIAEDFVPQLVILDLVMPGLDGYRVAKMIRAQRRIQAARLVALTGWSQEEAQRLAEDAGFDHFMRKPLDLRGLKQFLSHLFRSVEPGTGAPPTAQ